MAVTAFNSVVARRRDCAKQILADTALMSAYEKAGGTKEELQAIVAAGDSAEAFNLAQSDRLGANVASTEQVLKAFVALQTEYASIMAVTKAVSYDVRSSGADESIAARLDQILVNEAELTIKTIEKDGKKERRATRSQSQEALRAEIEKDAGALLTLTEAHPFLAKRRVDVPRLKALQTSAQKLGGKLAEKVASSAQRKEATKSERDAVAKVSQAWEGCYRILSLAGRSNDRIAELVRAASARA
jgi:hypothetical protein